MNVRDQVVDATLDVFVTALSFHMAENYANFTQLFMASTEEYVDTFKNIVMPLFMKCIEEIDETSRQCALDGGWPEEKTIFVGGEIISRYIELMLGGVDDEIESWSEE